MTAARPDTDRTTGARERRLVAQLRSGEMGAANVDDHVLPFFVKIQIQTVSYCNAACVTCPYPITSQTLPMGRMSADVFATIVDQFAGRGVERTSLFLMNEPLLDKRLEEFTALVKDRDPATQVTIITNGTLLDGARARSLAAAGMGEITVSVNGFDAETHARTMAGVDFERTMQNLREVGNAYRNGELGQLRLGIRALDMGDARAGAARFAAQTGLPVSLNPVSNRAGSIDTSTLDPKTTKQPRARPCQRPFVKAYVLYDGTMILCNCDWERTTVIGNVREQTLEELWHSPILAAVRSNHASGCLPEGSLCAGCDYPYLSPS